jgi:membrane protease YdiL (CAAX protease family)
MALVIAFPLIVAVVFAAYAMIRARLAGTATAKAMQREGPWIFAALTAGLVGWLVWMEGWWPAVAIGPGRLDLFGLGSVITLGLLLPLAAVLGWLQVHLESALARRWDPRSWAGGGAYPVIGWALPVPIAISVLAEELVWRAYLIPALAEQWKLHVVLALTTSSIMFGLHHVFFGWRHVIYKSLHGTVWSVLYVASGTIWLAVAAHAAFNAAVYLGVGRPAAGRVASAGIGG